MSSENNKVELAETSAEEVYATQLTKTETTLKDEGGRTSSKEGRMEDGIPSPEALSRDSTFVQKKKKRKLQKKWILVQVSRISPAFAAFGAILYIIALLASPSVWATNEATDAEILSRTSSRGTFVSVLIAILMNCMGWLMFRIGVKEGLVVTNYGFILGPVIGFMLDQGIGTEYGWANSFRWAGISYTFSSLIGGNFVRYVVTIFLDLFISNPLQDVMKRYCRKLGVIEELQKEDDKHPKLVAYDHFVALNFPSILQSIVAFVTFNAYTNQTRFAWAYPTASLDRELRIPPGTIMLSTAVAGVLYLNFYTIMDLVSDREYFDVNTKLMYVIFILLLLYGLNFTDSIEAPLADEEDNNITESIEDQKPALGFFIFLFFLCYGFVYPLYTRCGFCGYFIGGKPSDRELAADTDHITKEGEPALSEEIVNAIKRQIELQLTEHQRLRDRQQDNAGRQPLDISQ